MRRIRDSLWPASMPLAADTDFDLLAPRYPLDGESIDNGAIWAAIVAAGRRGVTLVAVMEGVQHRYGRLDGAAPSSSAPPLVLAELR